MYHPENYSAEEAKAAALALDCRKVRLWLAEHPGATSFEIKQATKCRVDVALAKMLAMKLVKLEVTFEEGGRRRRWYVIRK